MNLVKGDGNLVTHTLSVADYSEISAAHGYMEINYIQSNGAPSLTVTTDSNIYERFEFYTDDQSKALTITPKKEYRRNTSFRPSQFTVTTNSTALEGIDISGSCEFNVNSQLHTQQLNVDLSGSGKINLNDTAVIHTLDVNISGSGVIYAPRMENEFFKGSVAGSGTFDLKGKGRNAAIEISGSGKMKAIDFVVEELKAAIAGSGNIEITATNLLSIDVAGSGHVKYKGNPEIRKRIAGSGQITKID
jgi:hypothetical protein